MLSGRRRRTLRTYSRRGTAPSFISPRTLKGTGSMDAIMKAMDSWLIMGGLIVALLVLVGIMLFLRNSRKDEE